MSGDAAELVERAAGLTSYEVERDHPSQFGVALEGTRFGVIESWPSFRAGLIFAAELIKSQSVRP